MQKTKTKIDEDGLVTTPKDINSFAAATSTTTVLPVFVQLAIFLKLPSVL